MLILTKSKKDVILLQTKAHIDAVKKYNLKTYKDLQIHIKNNEAASIDDFCKKMEISKASFIVNACNYFITLNQLPPDSRSK